MQYLKQTGVIEVLNRIVEQSYFTLEKKPLRKLAQAMKEKAVDYYTNTHIMEKLEQMYWSR